MWWKGKEMKGRGGDEEEEMEEKRREWDSRGGKRKEGD